jgi:carbamoyl-phosphate synthase large subunit
VPADEWENLVARAGYPVVGKPTRDSGGSRDVALLASADEIIAYLEATQETGTEVMFQQYVGDGSSEYTVGVLLGRSGELIDSIVLRRELIGLSQGVTRSWQGATYSLSSGYSQGFIESHPQIAGECERLALALGARGPLNVQCRVQDGQVYVFEVHPRFSGSTSLRADVGFNETDVMVRNWCYGETFDRLEYQRDVAVMRAFQGLVVPIAEMQALRRPLGDERS